MKPNNNNIIVDLNKVSYGELLYVTHALGRTYKRHKKPESPTVNGSEFDCEANRIQAFVFVNKAILEDSIKGEYEETMLQYAKRKNLLDSWHPELTLQLSNNHSLVYTGSKALELWGAWKGKIFNKKK